VSGGEAHNELVVPRTETDLDSLAARAHTTLVDDIVIAVRERILHGELTPGSKIRQQELAERLGVSRTPLREAFQRLEAEGWVDLTARRGAEVRPLTATEAEEIFAMRVVLETAAARISAITHPLEAEPLAAVLIDPDGSFQHIVPLVTGIEDANRRFHDLVYGLQESTLPAELESSLSRYWARALRYRLVYWSRRSAVDRSRDAHQAVYDAWAARDPDACERAVAAHILDALHEITMRIDPQHTPSRALGILAGRYGIEWPTTRTQDMT
jgi:DNA-binding GntR family transcriptional regulator